MKEFVDSFPLGDAVEEIKKSQSTLSLTGMSKRRSRQISLVHHVGIEVVKTAIFIKRVFMVRARELWGFSTAGDVWLLHIYIPEPMVDPRGSSPPLISLNFMTVRQERSRGCGPFQRKPWIHPCKYIIKNGNWLVSFVEWRGAENLANVLAVLW